MYPIHHGVHVHKSLLITEEHLDIVVLYNWHEIRIVRHTKLIVYTQKAHYGDTEAVTIYLHSHPQCYNKHR